jgi:hypothetical protein
MRKVYPEGLKGELKLNKQVILVAFVAISVAGVSCSSTPNAPTSPSAVAAGASAANADGSTMKVTKPGLVTPFDGERIDGRRPTMIWQNSTGVNDSGIGVAYEIELWAGNGTAPLYRTIVGETPGTGSHTYGSDLAYDSPFSWRIRALEPGNEAVTGPWSDWGNFRTAFQPVTTTPTGPTTGPTNGTIGPARVISFNEAFNIIVAVHNGGRFNLGSGSSREYRVAFLDGAVAVIHYGHARYNPQGPDTNWCVKDAGGGRPQSDDVLVRCGSREAWDLIGGAGANGYNFHADYLGILPGGQNVYPPSRGSLNFIGQ